LNFKKTFIPVFLLIAAFFAVTGNVFNSAAHSSSLLKSSTTPISAPEIQLSSQSVANAKSSPTTLITNTDEEKKQYEEQLAKILAEMPTLIQQSKPKADSDGDIHNLQPDEFKEGLKLAEFRNLSLKNEKFLSSTQVAYADCSQRQDFAVTVRAVCFMRAMELSIKLKNPRYVVELNVPADVRELALKLVN
jgi:hypothetical protein